MFGLINFLTSSSDITSNSDLNSLVGNVTGFVKGYVMPVIYVALGVFLLVKGAMLGVQIVKAADEPQVRQEKINSLKWLVIGIAIAYGIAGAADIVMGVFETSIGNKAE